MSLASRRNHCELQTPEWRLFRLHAARSLPPSPRPRFLRRPSLDSARAARAPPEPAVKPPPSRRTGDTHARMRQTNTAPAQETQPAPAQVPSSGAVPGAGSSGSPVPATTAPAPAPLAAVPLGGTGTGRRPAVVSGSGQAIYASPPPMAPPQPRRRFLSLFFVEEKRAARHASVPGPPRSRRPTKGIIPSRIRSWPHLRRMTSNRSSPPRPRKSPVC